jgi:murein DD-endopeptidase MepM/ murein hydrolase activator NlpD
MFVVPGIGSYVLALMSALISSVVAAGALIILDPLGLPVLALPFVFTTQVILYTLRNRISPRFLKSITDPKESPEANLKHFKNPRARFVSDKTPAFCLPVSGAWTITQGFDGSETHKDLWAHALDFEVTDEMGKTYQYPGNQLSDYYSWNMPVFAPGDGIVTRVISHIDDNSVGQVNIENNWGNTVIIQHFGTVYSSMSHLAKDSVCVSEGETIRKGKMIGKVGNSGRSPYPHLHFQVQYSPELGAYTVPFNMVNYVSKETGKPEYHINGVPLKGQVIEAVQADVGMFDSASFPIGGKWVFDVVAGDKRWQETWDSEIDFMGNRFLRCKEKKSSLHFFLNKNVLLLLDYQGPSNTALEWFFLSAPCIPFTRQSIYRNEKMPAERLLKPLPRLLFDSVEPICELASLNALLHVSSLGMDQFRINTGLSLKQGFISKRASHLSVQSTFGKHRGLLSLHAKCSENTILRVLQRGIS